VQLLGAALVILAVSITSSSSERIAGESEPALM
jgi:hypothetical protein